MKKTIIVITLLISGLGSANAQKGKAQVGAVGNPNKTVSSALPDLTFDLVPALGGGYGFEKVKGMPQKIKVSTNYIVKNIGFVNSKPCKVYAHISYQRSRTHAEIEQGISTAAWLGIAISESVELQAIQNGKDVLEKQIFTFSKIPADAWGKRVRFLLKIEYGGTNGELSSTNNQSAPNAFDLINY